MKNELVIGKYTLESLTNGMYSSPLDLYREYIQNAVDSIDEALHAGLEKRDFFKIDIQINKEENTLVITDNGCGISSDKAIATLIDIGNSRKHRNTNRGFRGIGRLAGLGYCGELIFTTSRMGENIKTSVKFNAELLKRLLLTHDQDTVSVSDVMGQIISTETASEKPSKHYFEVVLKEVSIADRLLDEEYVKDYLLQHAPLPYSGDFKWRRVIQEKMRLAGYSIPFYSVNLNGIPLYKPYEDSFISDRVKKITDSISDIGIQKFYRGDIVSAILWYANSSFYGTVNDNLIKGIRIRQGNIMIGDRTTCNTLFKEERFNGWILGELHVLDPELIANSRRDDFEKNEAYYSLIASFKEWAYGMSKDIRRISYERSLSKEKKAIVEAESYEDINDLCTEDLGFAEDIGESDYLDSSESETVAETDYIGKLSFLLGQKKSQTKYKAININTKLTMEQRKVLERVFDLIQENYDSNEANNFINTIARNF